jgi:hypothetical protein
MFGFGPRLPYAQHAGRDVQTVTFKRSLLGWYATCVRMTLWYWAQCSLLCVCCSAQPGPAFSKRAAAVHLSSGQC